MFTFQSESARLSAVRPIKGTINSAQRCNLCVISTVEITIFILLSSDNPYAYFSAHMEHVRRNGKENIFPVNNPGEEK